MIVVTLDVDWAPDFVLEFVADELEERDVRSTWFVTHATPFLDRLRRRSDLFELGIHPNLRPRSSHGRDTQEVLAHMLKIVPEASSVRTHGLVQSGDLLGALATQTTLEADVSTFLPDLPGIRPVTHWRQGKAFLRVPFFWADDHEMERPVGRWRLRDYVDVPGLKVFTFHPVHIYLNAAEPSPYESIKRSDADLTAVSPELMKTHVRDGEGPRLLFLEIADYLATRQSYRVRDLVGVADWDEALATPS